VTNDLRDLMERLMSQPADKRFSCYAWMEQSGYTQEQRTIMLRLSSEMGHAAMEYLKEHPVNQWTADDWKRYELSQWDCTAQMRTSLLIERFTQAQADAIAEAWEHERYVFQSIQDGYGPMHHCRFCAETKQ
jgi:hypothetical protein